MGDSGNLVTSRKVRRPKRRKSAVKRKVKGVKKTSKTKVVTLTEAAKERLKGSQTRLGHPAPILRHKILSGIPLTGFEKAQVKELKKLGTFKIKLRKKPPKVDTPVIRAEKALSPGKARKRKALKKARARPRKQDYEDTGFQMVYVESSNLLAVGYNPSRRIMRVAFIGGNVYDYFHIPSYVFDTLLRASSHGKYLHWSIKIHTPQFDGQIYTYKKVR